MSDFGLGFSAQPRSFALSRMISGIRGRVDSAQSAAVTGRHADPAAALSGRTAEATNLGARLDVLGQFAENIGLAELRADVTGRALDALRALSFETANAASLTQSSELREGKRTVSETARAALAQGIALLNSSAGGRSLFAGNKTDAAALADEAAFSAAAAAVLGTAPDAATAYAALLADFDDAAGSFATTLYTGGAGDAPRAAIAVGETLSVSARADDPGVRDTLRNLVVLALAYDDGLALSDLERDRLAERAIAGLRAATDDVAGLRGRIGAAEERIATVKARNTAEEAGLTLALNELLQRDPYEAAVEFTDLERNLETLFATTARLSNLSLVNFLR